jgi:hypothetical protein
MFYHKNVLYTQNVCTIVCIMSRLVSWKRRFRQDYFHLFQNLGDGRWNGPRQRFRNVYKDVTGVFPAFLTYDVTKVVPTKVHLVSHMYVIQRFVSHRLYLLAK